MKKIIQSIFPRKIFSQEMKVKNLLPRKLFRQNHPSRLSTEEQTRRSGKK